MQSIIRETVVEDANTAIINRIIRMAVAQAPGAEVEDRRMLKVNAEQLHSGDIELTSKKHLDQNLVVDRVEEYNAQAVLVFYVGHDSPREVLRTRRVTVAR